ncbi:unnamed protein product [Schistosoma turkestanicum]|nr:unnamed protein product [Schistosoma turkestanicum]
MKTKRSKISGTLNEHSGSSSCNLVFNQHVNTIRKSLPLIKWEKIDKFTIHNNPTISHRYHLSLCTTYSTILTKERAFVLALKRFYRNGKISVLKPDKKF